MLQLSIGIFIGCFLSFIAILVGKKYSEQISSPYINTKKAEIIKRVDFIDEITKNAN